MSGSKPAVAVDGRGLAAVLALALGIRLYALVGDMSPDALVYAQHAYNLINGTFSLWPDSQYAHRLPVFTPTALLYAAFGVGKFTTHLWPLLLSLGQIVAVVWLGTRMFSPRTGVLSGALLAMFPLDVRLARQLLPDIVLGALITVSVVTWLMAFYRRPRPGRVLLLLSGVALAGSDPRCNCRRHCPDRRRPCRTGRC